MHLLERGGALTALNTPDTALNKSTWDALSIGEQVRTFVQVDADTPLADLRELAERAVHIDIAFGSFADGRGFSQAARLREDFSFTGTLRASGHVLPDQASHLFRVGFSSVLVSDELAGRHGLENWACAVKVALPHEYGQSPSAWNSPPIWQVRHAANTQTLQKAKVA